VIYRVIVCQKLRGLISRRKYILGDFNEYLMKRITQFVLVICLTVFLAPVFVLAKAVVEENIEDELIPELIPDFIEQGSEQQLANWEKIFGEDWVSVVNAVEAMQAGDIETFIKEGRTIMMIAPKILPKIGLDLVIPINQDYAGSLIIDPQQETLGVEVGNQFVQIKDVDSLGIESLLLSLGVIGYGVDKVDVKNLIDEKSLRIIADEVEAKTKLPIKLEKKKLFVLSKDKQKAKKLKKLPSQATQEVKSRYKQFELKQTTLEIKDDKAMYIVEGYIDGRVLGIFPIQFDVTAEYNAEKGSLDKMNKPWWEVFVF